MSKLVPLEDNVIVRMIEQEKKIGSIIIPGSAIEPSTLAEVVTPNPVSYWRNGERRDPFLKAGMRVRLPKGSCGTTCPESPEGETWYAVPEDQIYYVVE